MFSAAVQGCWQANLSSPPSVPATPTLTAARLTSTSLRATIADADAGATVTIYYRKTTDTSWSSTSRTGNGTKDVTGLTEGATYLLIAQAEDSGVYSELSEIVTVTLTADGDAASSIISLPLDHLETLIANCAAFQAWVSAVDADGAKAYIHKVAVESPTRPYALIYQADRWDAAKSAGGSRNFFGHEGDLGLRFTNVIDEAESDEVSETAFTNTVGLIIAEAEVLAGSGGYLHVTDFSKVSGPSVTNPDHAEEGVREQDIVFHVRWGV